MPVDVAAAHPWPPAFSPAFVDHCRALLEAAPVLVIVGPAGGNRNRLAAEVAGVPEGPARNRHVARFGEKDTPYFAIGQLFLDVHHTADASVDIVEASARKSLAATDGTPTLVLANTDLCDPQSIEVLVRLAESGDVRLVVTQTPETAVTHQRLLSAGHIVEIPPLDGATIAQLLHARFGAPPHPTLTELILQRSGGSYAVVQDLADASLEAGQIVVVEGVLALDPARPGDDTGRLSMHLAPLAAERLGGGRDITDLVHLTGLLGQLDLDEARTSLGDEVVDLATAHGTFTIVDGTLFFTVPAETMLVNRTLTLERQVELFEQFADAFPQTVTRPGVAVKAADWWRAAGRLLPVDLAARAAREANHLGHYRRALVYTDPASNDEHAQIAPIERGFALLELGDDELLTRAADIAPEQLSEDELFPFLRGLSALEPGEREALVTRAVSSDDPALQRRREAVRTLAELADQAFDTGDEKVANRLRALAFSGQLSPGNRAIDFATLAAVLRQSGRPRRAVDAAEFALEILVAERESVSAYHLDMAREQHILSLVTALDIEGADRALTAYSSGVFASADSGRITSAMQAYVAMARGDMAEALASAHLCLQTLSGLDPHHIRGWVEAMAAETLVHLGRDDEAQNMLDAALKHPSPIPQTDLDRRIALASSYDAFAEPEEGLEILSDVIAVARRRGLLQAHIDAAGASVLIGGPPQLGQLLEAVGGLVDPSGRPQVWQTFAHAARAYDIPALVDLARRLDQQGARLIGAGVAQFVLDMARRATDLTPATREHLTRLADLSAGAGDASAAGSQRTGDRPDE